MKLSKIFFLFVFALIGTVVTAQSNQEAALKEAGFNETEIKEVKAINNKYKVEAQNVRNDADMDRKEKGTKLRVIKEKRTTEIVDLVGQERFDRFQEVSATKRANAKEGRDTANADLNLTTEQETQMKEISKKYRDAGKELRKDKDMSDLDKKMRAKELRQQRAADIKAALTPEQYEQYIAMKQTKRG